MTISGSTVPGTSSLRMPGATSRGLRTSGSATARSGSERDGSMMPAVAVVRLSVLSHSSDP